MRGPNGLFDILSGTITAVGKTHVDESVEGLPVMVDALTLIVGFMSAVRPFRPLAPFNTKPFQIFYTAIDKLRFAPCFVDIFDPEQELSSLRSCPFLSYPEGGCMTRVKPSGGRWGDATAIWSEFGFRHGVKTILPDGLSTTG